MILLQRDAFKSEIMYLINLIAILETPQTDVDTPHNIMYVLHVDTLCNMTQILAPPPAVFDTPHSLSYTSCRLSTVSAA